MSGQQLNPYSAPEKLSAERTDGLNKAEWCRIWRQVELRSIDLANHTLLTAILTVVLESFAICVLLSPSFNEQLYTYSQQRILTLRFEIAYGFMMGAAFMFLGCKIRRRKTHAVKYLNNISYVAVLVAIAMTAARLWVFLSYFIATSAVVVSFRAYRIFKLHKELQEGLIVAEKESFGM